MKQVYWVNVYEFEGYQDTGAFQLSFKDALIGASNRIKFGYKLIGRWKVTLK